MIYVERGDAIAFKVALKLMSVWGGIRTITEDGKVAMAVSPPCPAEELFDPEIQAAYERGRREERGRILGLVRDDLADYKRQMEMADPYDDRLVYGAKAAALEQLMSWIDDPGCPVKRTDST